MEKKELEKKRELEEKETWKETLEGLEKRKL